MNNFWGLNWYSVFCFCFINCWFISVKTKIVRFVFAIISYLNLPMFWKKWQRSLYTKLARFVVNIKNQNFRLFSCSCKLQIFTTYLCFCDRAFGNFVENKLASLQTRANLNLHSCYCRLLHVFRKKFEHNLKVCHFISLKISLKLLTITCILLVLSNKGKGI